MQDEKILTKSVVEAGIVSALVRVRVVVVEENLQLLLSGLGHSQVGGPRVLLVRRYRAQHSNATTANISSVRKQAQNALG